MSNYHIIEIDICGDCLCWHANGTLPDDGERDEVNSKSFDAIIAAAGIDEGYDVIPNGDTEFFSHQPCEACRRPFGGSRFPAVMVQRTPDHITERKDA